jgi:small conductance mechanosensitive channel
MIANVLEWLGDAASSAAGTLLLAAVWVLAGFWFARFASGWVSRLLTSRSMSWSGTVLVSRLVSIGIRIVAIMFGLNALGVSGTGLIAVASAFTVAIGLSLQDVMKNFFAGVYLLLEQPFKAGDRIVIKDVSGEVQGIDIRTTMVRNINNELVLIPNATVFTEILHNDTFYGIRRVDLSITSPERRLDEIETALNGALGELSGIRRPLPEPRITSRTQDGLTVKMSVIVDNSDLAQNRIVEAVIDALPGDVVEVATT